MTDIILEVKNLTKAYDQKLVLNKASLCLKNHEVIALIGPSGSGKSTLLRCLNLLEIPDSGELIFQNKNIDYQNKEEQYLSCHRQKMGMVFQQFHLFSHKNALENVMEGPIHVKGIAPEDARALGMELLDKVGLSDKYTAMPQQLSGGQKQRVAIARALAMKPDVMLLDEPTSALDIEMITGINDLLSNLASEGMSMVIVTHDLYFAQKISQKIYFLAEGNICESGETQETLKNPQSPRLKEFLDQCRFE